MGLFEEDEKRRKQQKRVSEAAVAATITTITRHLEANKEIFTSQQIPAPHLRGVTCQSANIPRIINSSSSSRQNDRKSLMRHDNKSREKSFGRKWRSQHQLMFGLLLGLISLAIGSDLTRLIRQQKQELRVGQMEPLAAWASWIGEVPTAAELYGEAASEMPSTESFEDDDDDEELDASASNEYPDNDNDESYDDPEGEQQEEDEE